MKKILKWVGIAFLVLIVIGIFSPKSNKQVENKVATDSAKVVVVEKFINVDVKELGDEFEANQVAAEAKWKDLLVQFSAEVSNITDTGISFYKVTSKEFSLASIKCEIKDKEQLMSLKNGQEVTVRGKVGNQFMGIININDCQIVN